MVGTSNKSVPEMAIDYTTWNMGMVFTTEMM